MLYFPYHFNDVYRLNYLDKLISKDKHPTLKDALRKKRNVKKLKKKNTR